MGRIKSLMIKRAAKQILDKDQDFSTSFEENKKKLGQNNFPSKPIRNKIAGYIARLTKAKEVAQKA